MKIILREEAEPPKRQFRRGLFFAVIFPLMFLCLIMLIHNVRPQKSLVHYKILRQSRSYLVTETPSAVIYYTAEDEDYIALIKRSVDLFYPELLKDFSLPEGDRAEIVLYPDRQSFGVALGAPENDALPMGAYYGGIVNILSPSEWAEGEEASVKEIFLASGPLVHELTHLALDKKAEGDYPIWFTEGVALYYEHKYTGFIWREDLKEMAAQLELEDIEKNFRRLPEDIAYRKVYDLIYDYTEKNGEKSLQNLIGNLR